MKRTLQRQQTILGRAIRDIERKLANVREAAGQKLRFWLWWAQRARITGRVVAG